MFDRNRDEDNQDIQVAILQPHGVAVYLEARYLCTQMRGVRESSPLTRTTFWRGEYESNAELRAEFFNMSGVRL
jgi:GTP cyclohydrolase I